MAKLSDRQKNNILAKWNTGSYTKTELAKKYKVSETMIRKIVGLEKPTNAHFVQAGVYLEEAKKFEKSSIEVREIDNAIQYELEKKYSDDKTKLKIYNTTDKIIDKVNDMLDKGTKQQAVIVRNGESSDVHLVDLDYTPKDLESAMNLVDKASLTLNVNKRHANMNIDNSNKTQNNTIEYVGFKRASND